MASEMRMRDWSSDGCSSDRRAGGPKAEKGRQLESVRDQAQQRVVDHTASMQSSAPQLALLSRKQDLNAARVAANNTSFRFRSVLSRQYVAVAAVRKFSAELSDELSAQFRTLEGRYNRRSEPAATRKSSGSGKSGSVRVDVGGRGTI